MEKIYGYKQKEVNELIQYIKKDEAKPLSQVFSEFALHVGKSAGTIRNMYYALVKKSIEDKEFTDKYLDGKPLIAQKIENFDAEEEKTLVKTVLLGKKNGRSARSVILELSLGDSKKALRLQNKYRNVLKRNQKLVAQILTELKEESGSYFDPFEIKNIKDKIPSFQLKRLQNEINGLLDKVTFKLQRENSYLKNRVSELEIENVKLNNMLYGGELSGKTSNYFKKNRRNDMSN